MNCPNCRQAMQELSLAGHLGTTVTIDACLACHVFWFDARESLQLTPASTLKLFRLIGEESSDTRHVLRADSRCPRCGLTLGVVNDQQRATRFQYRRCPRDHGRLMTFFDFLREKNFIKPMSPAQLEELRRNLDAVHCSNCGATIDLTRESACPHCGSALSILDAAQAETLVNELRAADRTGQPVDPALPLRMEQARRESARALGEIEDPVPTLDAIARWLRRRV